MTRDYDVHITTGPNYEMPPRRKGNGLQVEPLPSRNELLTPEFICHEMLRVLSNNIRINGKVNRRFGGYFAGPKIGSTLHIRKPQRFVSPR